MKTTISSSTFEKKSTGTEAKQSSQQL